MMSLRQLSLCILVPALFAGGPSAAEEAPPVQGWQQVPETPSALSQCVEAFEALVGTNESPEILGIPQPALPDLAGPVSLSISAYGYIKALDLAGGHFHLPEGNSPAARVQAFLGEWTCLTGVPADLAWSLVLESVREDVNGNLVLSFRQALLDTPLFSSEVVVSMTSGGLLKGLQNRTIPVSVLKGSGLSPETVDLELTNAESYGPDGERGLFHPAFFESDCVADCLLSAPIPVVRKMQLTSSGSEWSFISPTQGTTVGTVSVTENDLPTSYGCFECVHDWVGYVPEWCSSNDPDCLDCAGCEGPDCSDVCETCVLVDTTYDFLATELGRISWDDGAAPLSLVPECICQTNPEVSHQLQFISDLGAPGDTCPYCDAKTFETPPGPCALDSWKCGISLGRGRNCLDVAVHETGHLLNWSERRVGVGVPPFHSKAIEEGFCDVLGEGAESWFSPGGTADWLHGTGGSCSPTRNLGTPSNSDTYGGTGLCAGYSPVVLPDHASMYDEFGGSGLDSGHYNATVLGKMAYLLARPPEDLPIHHWGIDVYGLGEECVRRAFYSAFKNTLLPADATFSDLWYPILGSFAAECGGSGYVASYIALAAMGFWIPIDEMRRQSEYAISTEYYPAHPAHPYWVFMNIGDDLVAFGRECRVSESCPYTVQILGQTERGISTTQYDDEIHVFALGYGSDSPPVYHWKIGSDGVAVALGLIPGSRSDRTPSAINKDGTMYVVYRDAATSQVRFARFVPDTPPVWELEDTPFSTPGAAGAVVTPYFTYLFYPDQNWDMQYQLWANSDDDWWLGPSPFFPGTPYREMSGEEPPGVEWYKDRLHLSYPNERTGGAYSVYGSCTWPCWSGNPWTLIGKIDGRDPDSLWVYLNGTSQNDNGLYQFRGWEDHGEVENITWRWKASE